jgi:hypothetical protein
MESAGGSPEARERESKRPKEGEEAAAATSAREGADAAGAGDKKTATAATAAAPSQKQQEQQEHQQRDRTAQVLFLVLENLRQPAREARAAARRELLRALEAGLALDPPAVNWTLCGGADEDGEDRAVTGAGWYPAARGFMPPLPGDEDEDEDEPELFDFHLTRQLTEAFGGEVPDADGFCEVYERQSRDEPVGADDAFFATCAAASRCCRAWRGVSFRAADRATIS